MEQTDVLIVGAGPTGQTLALTLARHGVRPLIVDQASERSDKSRAVIVQARTLETYRTLGFADEFLQYGRKGFRFRQHVRGKPVSVLELTDLGVKDTRYPFAFFISQADTEAILDRALARAGLEIERPVKATAFEQQPDGIVVTLDGPKGERKVKAKWVVGCDGAHSVVRKAAGLSFEGSSYPQVFLLADVKAPELPGDELSFFFGEGGLVVGIPLGQPGYVRLLCAGQVDDEVSDNPTLEDLIRLVEKVGNRKLALSEPTWVTRFRLHRRGVEHYRSGRFFVAGDAAHIHSPAGGQSMNTGIQDAYNLGWKLALVVRGESDETLLDTYHEERLPIAKQVMKTTDRVFTLLTSRSPFVRFLRLYVIPRVAPRALSSVVRREKAFRFASQLAMSYPNSSVVKEAVPGDATPAFRAAPGAGSRMPDGPSNGSADSPWLYDLLREAKHHLVLVASGATNDERASALMKAETACAMRNSLVEPFVIDRGALAEQLAGDKPATYLVRPDNVIAFRAPGFAVDKAMEHLDRTLGRARPQLVASTG